MTSIADIHKFKIRWVQRRLSPFICQQVTARQPHAEDISQQAPDSSIQWCLHLVQAACAPLLKPLSQTSQLQHALCHTAPAGCPSPWAALSCSTSHFKALEMLPCCCLHGDAQNTLASVLLGHDAAHSHPAWENGEFLHDRSNAAEQLRLKLFEKRASSEPPLLSLPDTLPSCLLCSPAS